MRENPYKRLPPIERKQDGSLYRMTPAQRKQAASLIRRECCCFEDGNCIVLDDGDTCTCPQTISFSVCSRADSSPAFLYREHRVSALCFCLQASTKEVKNPRILLKTFPGSCSIIILGMKKRGDKGHGNYF